MTLQPYGLARGAGEARGFVGSLTWITATGTQTGGAFGLKVPRFNPP